MIFHTQISFLIEKGNGIHMYSKAPSGHLSNVVALWYMQQNPTSLLIPTQPCHTFTSPRGDCWLCRRAMMYRLLRKVLVSTTLQTCHFSAFCFIMKYLIFWSLVGVEFGGGEKGVGRQGGCGIVLLSLFFIFFFAFCVLLTQLWKIRKKRASKQ